ncbi:MAG: glycosyltransferase family 2 protein [Parcubacteria group bacterium]|nr:glycosyltransferase family 2 protein [Parcubacteria group bacterium]
MPKVQIQIVTHNSQEHLERLFRGIAKQQGVDFDILVIDNASTDGTLDWVRKYHPEVRVITNNDNKGFARAHNQGFAECAAPYVLVLNPDVELQEGCLKEMVAKMEADPPFNPPLITGGGSRIAAVAPKTYKILPFGQKSGIIDSLGIKILPWGQVANTGENKLENAKFEPTERVWGVSGACALYRLSALESAKDKYGIFDERFWMYKEDADLAWRLNRTGYESRLAIKAMALHQRAVSKGNRKSRHDWAKEESYKNHLLMLKKNLSWRDWWRMPFVAVYELLKFIYVPLLRR